MNAIKIISFFSLLLLASCIYDTSTANLNEVEYVSPGNYSGANTEVYREFIDTSIIYDTVKIKQNININGNNGWSNSVYYDSIGCPSSITNGYYKIINDSILDIYGASVIEYEDLVNFTSDTKFDSCFAYDTIVNVSQLEQIYKVNDNSFILNEINYNEFDSIMFKK